MFRALGAVAHALAGDARVLGDLGKREVFIIIQVEQLALFFGERLAVKVEQQAHFERFVFQDATGRAFERVVALGIGVGSGYLFETDFKREVYSDLTGERGTLMGAIQGIFAAQYETLRANGHTPSEAFNETVEELTQSLMPLVAENGMDWMYANCSTTAQRGALDWWKRFRDATKPVFEELYREVAAGNEAQRSIDLNSKPDYREKLDEELRQMRESEMWQTGAVVRKLRPENN